MSHVRLLHGGACSRPRKAARASAWKVVMLVRIDHSLANKVSHCGEESSVLRIRRSIEHLLLNESQQMVA
jgi:hypothetical protein